jgi:ribonuclease-3
MHRLPYDFSDAALEELAFTHSSLGLDRDNERLEFLGDAVLGLVVAERLMRARPEWDEGELSRARSDAVNRRALAARARALGLDDLIRLGRGERRSGGRTKDSILANAFEAVLGALYEDGGLEAARAFLERELPEAELERATRSPDPKTTLQERLQASGRNPPHYETIATRGPAHAREFEVEVRAGAALLGVGSGRSKRDAEQAAARSALAHPALEGPAGAREKEP